MDKVKTYVVGLVSGFESAFESLDEMTGELGNVEIKSITDQYLIVMGRSHMDAAQCKEECVKRTVVYRTLDDKV